MVGNIKPIPMLDEPSIANCQLFVDRGDMVRALAAPGGIGVEVGYGTATSQKFSCVVWHPPGYT